MHDIKEIAQAPEEFANKLQRRGENVDVVSLIDIHQQIKSISGQIDDLRARRNEVSCLIGESKRNNSNDLDIASLGRESKEIGTTSKELEEKRLELETKLNSALLHIPNLPSDRTPDGKNENDNVLIREVGEKTHFDFEPKDHLEIAERLQLLDFPRGGKITGSGFPVWSGWGGQT